MDDQELYRTASRRADAKIGFYIHLTVYVLVNLLLISINLIYEATQNAPPLAVGMNESESESKFENGAKRLRLIGKTRVHASCPLVLIKGGVESSPAAAPIRFGRISSTMIPTNEVLKTFAR